MLYLTCPKCDSKEIESQRELPGRRYTVSCDKCGLLFNIDVSVEMPNRKDFSPEELYNMETTDWLM